jgi:hypothetical protein
MLITADYFLAVRTYVAFRCSHPNAATVQLALEELQNNCVDINELVEFSRDHCS